jgi:hypothetical protein
MPAFVGKVKLSLCLTNHHAMKKYGLEVQFYALTMTLEGSGQSHATVALLPGKEQPVPIKQKAGWTLGPVLTLCHLRLGLPSSLFRSNFPTEIFHVFFISSMRLYVRPISSH